MDGKLEPASFHTLNIPTSPLIKPYIHNSRFWVGLESTPNPWTRELVVRVFSHQCTPVYYRFRALIGTLFFEHPLCSCFLGIRHLKPFPYVLVLRTSHRIRSPSCFRLTGTAWLFCSAHVSCALTALFGLWCTCICLWFCCMFHQSVALL